MFVYTMLMSSDKKDDLLKQVKKQKLAINSGEKGCSTISNSLYLIDYSYSLAIHRKILY